MIHGLLATLNLKMSGKVLLKTFDVVAMGGKSIYGRSSEGVENPEVLEFLDMA